MIKTIFAAAALLAATVAASAQQPVPPPVQKFVPFTVTEQDAENLKVFLQDVPFKFSAPIFQWMARLETDAVASESRKTEVKPPPETSPDAGAGPTPPAAGGPTPPPPRRSLRRPEPKQ